MGCPPMYEGSPANVHCSGCGTLPSGSGLGFTLDLNSASVTRVTDTVYFESPPERTTRQPKRINPTMCQNNILRPTCHHHSAKTHECHFAAQASRGKIHRSCREDR